MNTIETRKWNMPALLRQAGAAVLVCSGVSFMLEGWGALTSIEKFMSFMAFSILLGLAGVVCSRVLKENKGARTFLALAAATVTVHFSQLGALLYAFAQGAASRTLPSALTYQVPTLGELFAVAAVCAVVLVPIARLGFLGLIRSQERVVTPSFLGLCFLLLVPSRDSGVMLPLLAAGAVFLIWIETRCLAPDSRCRTGEGSAARFLLATPLLVLAGRSLLYFSEEPFFGALLLSGGAYLFLVVPRYLVSTRAISAIQRLSAVVVGIGWFQLADGLLVGWEASTFLVRTLPVAMIWFLMSNRASGNGSEFRKAGSLLSTLVLLAGLVAFNGILMPASAIATGFALLAFGANRSERLPFVTGIICAAAGALSELRFALDFCLQSPWISLAVLGTLAVLAASCAESQSARVGGWVSSWKLRIASWN